MKDMAMVLKDTSGLLPHNSSWCMKTSVIWQGLALVVFTLFLCSVGGAPEFYTFSWDLATAHHSHLKIMGVADIYNSAFVCTVCFIALNVMWFSRDYMPQGSLYFNSLVSLFVLSMIFLAFSGNLFCLAVGWDGLGLSSYLLVIFYPKAESLAAGMLTALSNRVGDALLALGLGLSCGVWGWETVWVSSGLFALVIFFMASTKSAQFPFCSWLPAAMAAPTPVSSLVHSSTLVTAGVFLLIRNFDKLSSCPSFSVLCTVGGMLTMYVASFSAVVEVDLKKVVALSTLSQLGFMVWSLGIGSESGALFHLLSHALFKALLFISVGYLILFTSHNQDTRFSAPSANLICVSSCFVIANAALVGAPFMGGFFSKDLILEYSMGVSLSLVLVLCGLLSVAFTTLYSGILLLGGLISINTSTPGSSVCDSNVSGVKPLLVLATGAVCGGAGLSWLLFNPSLPSDLGVSFKLAPLVMVAFGVGGVCAFSGDLASSIKGDSNSLVFLTDLSTQPIAGAGLLASRKINSSVDQGWLSWGVGSRLFWRFYEVSVVGWGGIFTRSWVLLVLSHSFLFLLLLFIF